MQPTHKLFEIVEPFVRKTLGCTCPEEVFETITLNSFTLSHE